MSAIDQIIATTNGLNTPNAAALLISEDAATNPDAPLSVETRTVDGFAVRLTSNGRAVAEGTKSYGVNGKATEADKLLSDMLACKRGAEAVIRPMIKIGTDGFPRPQYATRKIQSAMLRLKAHEYGRVTVQRLEGSMDESTGSVTFGGLLVTVKPVGR